MKATVEITSLAYGGRGVGRVDGKVVFVPFTAPGDVVEVEIIREKKSFSEGEVRKILSPSTVRTEPECPYFGVCGGCALQHISYPEQVASKEKVLLETLERIGKVTPAKVDPPIPCEKPYGYRSRARFHVKGGRVGFFESGSRRVVDIESCPILDPALNDAYRAVRSAVAQNTPPGLYVIEMGVGVDGRTVAAFHVSAKGEYPWQRLLEGTGLKGLEVRFDPSRRERGRKIEALGDLELRFGAGGMDLVAGVTAFTQVNPSQNEHLVEKVLEYASLSGEELVVDLFSGVGNLTLPAAGGAERAVGVEAHREAVRYARENAKRNSVGNVKFKVSDALDWLGSRFRGLAEGVPCVLILDPPRGGESGIAGRLSESGALPRRIVYVSCSPPTLARDLYLLAGCGYTPARACLIDMFPQTYHIESAVVLERGG